MRLARGATIGFAVALFAGCGGVRSTVPVPSVRFNRGGSWMSPEAKSAKLLLYVGDWDTNDAFVYDYPSGQLVGTLTGGSEPYGMCVDATGDIYIANFGAGNVVEYAHGGTTILKTYDSGGEPIGCSLDAAGDLAVTSFSPGELVVFRNGDTSKEKTYTSSACEYMWTGSYDDKGNIYAFGEYSSITLCELPAKARKMRTVSVSCGRLSCSESPGGFTWDGRHLAAATNESGFAGGIVRFAELPGGDLKVVGVTKLTDNCYDYYVDLVNPFILGKKNTPANRVEGYNLVGPNLWCADAGTAKVDYWKYPKGGLPFKNLASPPGAPYGAAVSIGT